jgi:hypothetical protein
MDQAAAHERIEDLLLEPTRLAALGGSADAADAALREHVASCPVCRADLEAWQVLQGQLAGSLAGSADAAAAAVEPIELPPSLRAGVAAAIREDAAAVRAGAEDRAVPSPSRFRVAARLALAASIIMVFGLGAVAFDQVQQRDAAEADARAFTSALAAVDRVLKAPEYWVVPLTDAAGANAGSISWSSQDLVVLTTALAPPPAGQRYRCWLVESSTTKAIGMMYYAGRTADWVGSLDEWATFRIGPGTRFAVTLQEVGATTIAGPILLSADLGP